MTPENATRVTCTHSTGTVCSRCFGLHMLDHEGATYQFANAADLVQFTRERYDSIIDAKRVEIMALINA